MAPTSELSPSKPSEAAAPRQAVLSRWGAALRSHPRLTIALILLVGAILYLPALLSPFLLDDYLHQSMVDGTFPSHRGPFDLYNFVDDADRGVLLERGMLPWWSHPNLTIRFFRPLSSAMLWADHRFLGDLPLAMHLHSLAWWAAAILAARALFKRSLPPRTALIATVIFALAPCHTLPLAWLANREALVSLTFSTLALGAHLRFREGRGLHYAFIAAALFGLALLGGEYALCFGGYVLAIDIAARGRRTAARAAGLLPFAVPAAAYLLVRARLHYGTIGSGFYSDPLGDPVAFLRTAPRRMATLLLQAWGSLDNETLTASTPAWLLALFVSAGVALLLVPLERVFAKADARVRETGNWMLAGSILALVPVLAVVSSPRVLGASLLGVSVIVALILDHAWFETPADDEPTEPSERRGRALTGLVALALGFASLVHAPVTAWLVGRQFKKNAVEFAAHTAALAAQIPDLERAEIVVVRGMVGSFFLPFALDHFGHAPARWRTLAETGHALALRRGPRTLDIIVPKDQSVFPIGHGNLFRSGDARLAAGDTFSLPGMRVTVVEVGAEGPRIVRYEFDRDLDEKSLTWITEDYDAFPEVTLPDLGFGKPFDP